MRTTTGSLRVASVALLLALSTGPATSSVSHTADLEIGDVTVTDETLATLLPEGTVRYTGTVDSAYTVLHNTSSWHGLFFFQGHLREQAYRTLCTAAGVDTSSYSYTVTNDPLPVNHRQTLEMRFVLGVLAAAFLLISLSLSPAASASFVVHERALKSKHLQHLSGASTSAFWAANFLFDGCGFLLLAGGTMLCLFCYGDTTAPFFSSRSAALATFLLLVGFGFATLSFNYALSFLFTNRSTAQIGLGAINFATAFLPLVVYGWLLSTQASAADDFRDNLSPLFRAFPPFCLGEGLLVIVVTHFQNYITGDEGSLFAQDRVGLTLVCMGLDFVLFMSLTLLLDSSMPRRLARWWRGGKPSNVPHASDAALDPDVATERRSVQEMVAARADPKWSNTASLLVSDLHKKYSPMPVPGGQGKDGKHAVRGLSLAVPENECFGLLGVNGAGKTTTMSVLTGDVDATRGLAEVAGCDISDPATRRRVGYCPQVDALLPLMTARETLTFFGRLKGLANQNTPLDQVVNQLIDRVGLAPFADKPCNTYSGGTKRKLSFAVALIGEPPVLLLDEPSTGMDPVSRRQLWRLISDASQGRSVVLTTHLMEECEALCNRVAIMVDGQFKCLGSVPHLKSRFGDAYKLEVRCLAPQPSNNQPVSADKNGDGALAYRVNNVVAFVGKTFAGTTVDERHSGFVRFKVPKTAVTSIADLFQAIEEAKQRLFIEDYALGQGTLEQIFIHFARQQEAAEALAPPTPTKKAKAAVFPFQPSGTKISWD